MWKLVPIALLMLLFGAISAHAESHIYLSCSHGHAIKKTTLQDGSVQTERHDEAMSYALDIDFEQRTINSVYRSPFGRPFENAATTIVAVQYMDPDEHTGGFFSGITIDRLTGMTEVYYQSKEPRACYDEWRGRDVRKAVEVTTTYQCVPASPKF